MASDVLIGRKAASNGDIGVGEMAINETRLTLLAQLTDDYWLTHLGCHVGWDQAGTPPTATMVIYATENLIAKQLVGRTAAFTTRAVYGLTAYGGGESIQLKLQTPIILGRNYAYLAGMHTTVNELRHAMNNDGSLMSRDYGPTSPPANFQTDRRDPQGRMSVWGIVRKNTAPSAPSSVLPANGSQTTDILPTISGDFRDPDETLTGFGIGTADKMTAYRVIVYNSNKTQVIADSGNRTPTPTEVSNRRFSWTVPSNMAAGQQYVVRATVRDRCNAWSAGTEWSFTVLAGGAMTVTGPSGRIVSGAPNMTFSYTHRNGTALDKVNVRLWAATLVAGPTLVDIANVAAGASGTITWAQAGFPVLPRGADYAVQMQPVDTMGVAGAWSPVGPTFRRNQLPLAPANLVPESGSVVTKRPVFRATLPMDPDQDAMTGMVMTASVGISGSTTSYEFPLNYTGMSGTSGVFEGQPPEEAMADYGSYTWSVYAVDPMGESSATVQRNFTYASPPTITIVTPATGTPVVTPTPTVTYTSDPAPAQHRIRWVESGTNAVVRDTGLKTATGSDTVVSGEVRTGREYDVIVGVKTGAGAYDEAVIRVLVQYPLPAALTSQTVSLVAGEFDTAWDPSVVRRTWNDPSSETAYRGNAVYRQVGEGPWERIATIDNYTARTYDDDTAPMNDTLRYYVTRYNDMGLDTLESAPPSTPPVIVMNFGGTIISDVENPGLNRIVARYWLNRSETPVRAREVREGWGRYATVFHGERNYVQLSGTWDVIDEEEFSATQLKDAMVRLADPIVEMQPAKELGGPTRLIPVLRPRLVCYRDGIGRVYFGHLSIERVEDTHQQPHDVRWTFIETSKPYPVPSLVQTVEIEDNELDPLQGLFGGSWQ